MDTGRSYVRFVAVGDSVTYGLGDRASKRSRGWARLLAAGSPRTEPRQETTMRPVIPQNHSYLRDAFGSPITDGACVLDHDREVGYVRLDAGPSHFGPDSAYWDGWFNVTRTRTEHPLRGKLMRGDLVQVLRGGSA